MDDREGIGDGELKTKAAGVESFVVVTPFWAGDVKQAMAHYRLVSRYGLPQGVAYKHLFKLDKASVPANTFRDIAFADIDKNFPDYVKASHPAGPNLCFVYAVRHFRELGYDYMFWMEPDCVPTDPNWCAEYLKVLRAYPDAPIIGPAGGVGGAAWKHHFAGCSIYNLKALNSLPWDEFVEQHLEKSFDIWLSQQLGYIELLDVTDDPEEDGIIFGEHRYLWRLLKKPDSVVAKTFDHWRPGKFLSSSEVHERILGGGYLTFHACKEIKPLRALMERVIPKVSIIIFNYNYGHFLKEAIESCLCQDYPDVEVIVADDGSTDAMTEEVLSEYEDLVHILRLSHGQLTPNFNQQRLLLSALGHASGEIVCLLDADDIMAEHKCSVITPFFDDPKVVCVQHCAQAIDEKGIDIDSTPVRLFHGSSVTLDDYLSSSKVNQYQPTSFLSFRRDYLERVLPLLRVNKFENTWLDVRLTRLAPFFGKVANSQQILGCWRRHRDSDSISQNNLAERLREHHRWFRDQASEFNFSLQYEESIGFAPHISCGPSAESIRTTEVLARGVELMPARWLKSNFEKRMRIGFIASHFDASDSNRFASTPIREIIGYDSIVSALEGLYSPDVLIVEHASNLVRIDRLLLLRNRFPRMLIAMSQMTWGGLVRSQPILSLQSLYSAAPFIVMPNLCLDDMPSGVSRQMRSLLVLLVRAGELAYSKLLVSESDVANILKAGCEPWLEKQLGLPMSSFWLTSAEALQLPPID